MARCLSKSSLSIKSAISTAPFNASASLKNAVNKRRSRKKAPRRAGRPLDRPRTITRTFSPKRVPAHGLKLHDGKLAMGLQDEHGIIWQLSAYRRKRREAFPLRRRKHLSLIIGVDPIPLDFDGVIYVGEGFATMASVFAATGAPCIVALDCGKLLLAVAKALRAVRKKARFVICAG